MSSLCKGVCSQSRLAEFTGASLSVITTGVVPTASHRYGFGFGFGYVLYPYVQRGPSVNAILHGIATPAAIRHRSDLSPRRQCRRAVQSTKLIMPVHSHMKLRYALGIGTLCWSSALQRSSTGTSFDPFPGLVHSPC